MKVYVVMVSTLLEEHGMAGPFCLGVFTDPAAALAEGERQAKRVHEEWMSEFPGSPIYVSLPTLEMKGNVNTGARGDMHTIQIETRDVQTGHMPALDA